ncbi:uncharacterized protein LAJ45_08813 [Morchella importuna]|nr:uncharacterized protein LAJ45_08813 [Morchella importuna]KAH8147014.1 hypothetical protein LAJ45_08813 [Morchella importuna]
MRSFTTAIILGASALPLSFVAGAKPYSQWMADSVIARKTPLGKNAAGSVLMTYDHGVFERALEMVYNVTGNATYLSYLKTGVDNIMNSAGTLLDYDLDYYTLDDVRLGPEFIYMYLKTGTAKYKTAADTLRLQLQTQTRNKEGGFWHRSTYPNQMWLDGLYMQAPFYTQYTSFFQPTNTTAYNDIVKQFDLIEKYTRNSTNSLLKHGYDESKVAVWADPVTGESPEVWDRALGWYLMALLDVLDYFPASHAGATTLKNYFIRAVAGVKAAADPTTGGWWLVMSEPWPGHAGNYIETSGTAMFVYAMLKGIRKGYISKADYFPTAEKAYKLLLSDYVVEDSSGLLNWEGTVNVGSLGSNGTFEYYISVAEKENDFKGLGPFIYASIEYEQMTST